MKSTIKKLPNCQMEIEFELSAQDLDKYIERAILIRGQNMEIEGFRKGKAPKEIVEKKVGKENILVDAADLAVQENYKKTISENKIGPLLQPEIDILKLAPGNEFRFRARISVLPDLELPDYKKIGSSVRKNKVFVEEGEINSALDWLKKSRTKFSLKNDAAQLGDFVEIEYWSSQIPELNQPAGKKDKFILGEGHFLQGFEDAIVGMKAGEEKKDISLTMPENSPLKNLSGKKVDFRVKMNSVQKAETPELNDQFAKTLGEFENLAALKTNVKNGILMEKEQAESQRIRNDILEKIGKEIKWEIPEVLVKQEQERMFEEFKHTVSEHLKMPLNDYLIKIKKTEKEIRDSFLAEAEKRVKSFLILREVGKSEKIEVSEAEVSKEADKILKHYSGAKNVQKALDPERLKVYTENAIRQEKIFKLLENIAK